MIKMQNVQQEQGVTLIELLLYLVILVVTSVSIGTFSVEFIKLYTASRAQRDLVANAGAVMDTIAFQAFHAEQIYDATSLFDIAAGQLSFRTSRNSPVDESVTYNDYWLANGRVWEKAEGTLSRPLTNDRVVVTSFLIHKFLSGVAEGVSVDLVIHAPTRFGNVHPTMTFTRFTLIRQR